jgi:hypothetical protein
MSPVSLLIFFTGNCKPRRWCMLDRSVYPHRESYIPDKFWYGEYDFCIRRLCKVVQGAVGRIVVVIW